MSEPWADLEPDLAPDWSAMVYQVFNPDQTVGVACNRNGEIVGLHLTDEARDQGDTWLAGEIVRIARLAHEKSRVGLRMEMEYKGTPGYVLESLGLPSESDYMLAERAEFG